MGLPLTEYMNRIDIVATALGGTVKHSKYNTEFKRDDFRSVITLASGAQIGVTCNLYGQRDRISFAHYTRDNASGTYRDGERPEITCSIKKDAAALIKDVQKRLLPRCDFEREEQMIANHNNYERKLAEGKAQLLKLDSVVKCSWSEGLRCSLSGVNIDSIGSDNVSLSLRCIPFEVAVQVIQMMEERGE